MSDFSTWIENNGTFEGLNLRDEVLKGLYAYGIDKPQAFQAKAILPCLQGKDVILQAKSGMGKTLVFMIALLQNIDLKLRSCQAIVVEPTRELAKQNYKVLTTLAQFMDIGYHLAIGEHPIEEDEKALNKGVQIIVCTDGRLFNLIEEQKIDTSCLRMFIMDEFDKLLGTKEHYTERSLNEIKGNFQYILLSATAPQYVFDYAKTLMNKPLVFKLWNEELTLLGIQQFYIETSTEDSKKDLLFNMINDHKGVNGQGLIFSNFRRKVEEIMSAMKDRGIEIVHIHGKMKQKDRNSAFLKLKSGQTQFIITSDLLCRGIDIQHIKFIINYDLPRIKDYYIYENYIHRIGRCGRFGRKGKAISFVLPHEEEVIKDYEKCYSTQIIKVSDFDSFFE